MLALWFMACDPTEQSPTVMVQTLEQRMSGLSLTDADSIRARRVELGERLRSDPDPAVRAAIASALAYSARDRESIPALAAALEVEQDIGVQRRLVATLASFSEQPSADAIVAFWVRGVAPELEEDVLSALGGCDPGRIRAAVANHPDADPARVERALAALPR